MTKKSTEPLTIVGTGLVALDVIASASKDKLDQPALWDVGGTCGNVVSILGFLGHEVVPIARVGTDKVSKEVCRILTALGVSDKYLLEAKGDDSPVVMHYIKAGGAGEHRFDLRNPIDRSFLPRYRPVTIRQMEDLLAAKPQFQIAYLDRINPGSIALAKYASENGALVMVEPRAIVGEDIAKLLPYCDVVKVSAGFDNNAFPSVPKGRSVVIIETMGAGGLRCAVLADKKFSGKWVRVPAYVDAPAIDTAGAGDWTTAYLMHAAVSAMRSRSLGELEQHLMASRNWAALAIRCRGARGLMRCVQASALKRVAECKSLAELAKSVGELKSSTDGKESLRAVLKRFALA